MIAKCRICRRPVDDWKDVRWTLPGGTVLCSLACLWRYRGKEKCV